jgi:O-methyltransferase
MYTNLYTAISSDRLENIVKYVKQTNGLEGDVAEFGVFEGGSLDVIAKNVIPSKNIYGIDSFEGLPEPHKTHDLLTWNICKGGMKADFETTKLALAKYTNLKLIKGFFHEAIKELPKNIKFSFVHIDVDLYQSVKDACEYFYPKLVKNGIIISDDYEYEDTPGAKIALHEYFGNLSYEKMPSARIHLCMPDGTKQCQYLIIK